MVEPIKLYPEDEGPKLSLYEETATPLPSDVVTERAKKAQFGLGNLSPEFGELVNAISYGAEKDLRKSLAMKKSLEDRKARMLELNEFTTTHEGPVTESDVARIQELSKDTPVDPGTIIEREYGRRLIDENVPPGEEDDSRAREVAHFQQARKEIAQTKLEELQAKQKASPWFGKGSFVGDQLEQFIPFKSWYNTQNEVGESTLDSVLPGSNKQEQYQYLLNLHPDQMAKEFNAAVDRIAERNLQDAINYANGLITYGRSDEFLDNAFGLLDVADVVPFALGLKVAKGAAKGVKSVSVAKKAMKDVVKAAGDTTVDEGVILAASGDVEKAATVNAVKTIKERLREQDPNDRSTNLFNSVISLMSPKRFQDNPTRLSREATQRITSNLDQNAENLLRATTDPTKVNRLTDTALAKAVEDTKTFLTNKYVHIGNGILDILQHSNDANLGNIATMEVHIGRVDGTLFQSPLEATRNAEMVYNLDPGAYRVQQQGKNFYISLVKDVDETTGSVRDAIFDTNNETPRSLISTFLGWLRTPEDTLDVLSRDNRHAATHGSQELMRLVGEVAQPIKNNLSKTELDNLNRILEANRDDIVKQVNPDTNQEETLRGRFFNSIGEFEEEWKQAFNEYPSEKAAEAYFTFVQLNDFDYVMRNLGMYRDKARQGIENYRFQFKHTDGAGRETVKPSAYFDGKAVDHIPEASENVENAGVWVLNDDTGEGQFFYRNDMTDDNKAYLRQMLDSGYKIIQIANPAAKPLLNIAGHPETINFAVVKSFQVKPLDFKQIPYRGGGHVQYEQEWFVKQPIIRRSGDDTKTRHFYEGDRSMATFTTEAEARKYGAAIEKGRQLLGNDTALKAHLEKTLPYDLDEFKGFFEPKRNKEGNVVKEAMFHKSDKFVPVRSKQGVNDALRNTADDLKNNYDNYEDLIDSTYNLFKDVNKKFGGERDEDLPTILENTYSTNGLALERPKLLDPLSTFTKATSQLMRNRFIEDYQYQSMNQWIEEFASTMSTPLSEMRKDTMKHFYEPVFAKDAPADKVAAAKNAHRAIVNFLGSETPLSKGLSQMKHKLISSIYTNVGQKASNVVANHLLPTVKDPTSYVRAIAFHTKLGLFNPVQVFVQGQTLAHMTAVTGNPLRAMTGISGAYLMRRLSLTNKPEIINHFANMATKLGWKKEDFLESYEEFKKSGLYTVAGETAWRDDVFEPQLFNGKAAQYLDKGTVFFKETERFGRISTWNIAYKEWKKANPSKKIDSRARNQIMTRADTLSVNMTRASNSAMQQGVMSVPIQFFTYQARLAEQFLSFGKKGRLTAPEKMRAFAMNSMLYGVPVATGGTVALWPFYEDIKQAALERSIPVSDGFLEAMMEGLPAVMLELATGNEYNVGPRYGPGGLSVFKELVNGEKTFAEILLGASGSIGADIVRSTEPVFQGIADVFSGNQGALPLLVEDFIDATSNISAVNNTLKMIYALNTGRYITKNEIYMDDVDTWDAVFMGITGMSPRALSDTFIRIESMTELRDVQNTAKKEAIKYLRRGFVAKDREERILYFKRAKVNIIGAGFLPTQYGDILLEAFNGNESLVNKINRDFYMTKAPADEIKARQDLYLGRTDSSVGGRNQ